jgi:hypothetical protein
VRNLVVPNDQESVFTSMPEQDRSLQSSASPSSHGIRDNVEIGDNR